jgi:peptidoglycan hydrolase-like protein with peptidoglycan-binding domain
MPLPTFPRPRWRRSRVATALTTAALLASGPLLLAPSAGAAPADPLYRSAVSTVPLPAAPASVPADIEGLARYVPANSCDPHAKPGTTAVGDLLKATYGSFYGIDRTCGTDPLPTSEHYDGRALDYFLDVHVARQRAEAQALIAWLFADDAQGRPYANARRLGVMYLIWNNRIWGAYRAAEGWRPYSSCAVRTSAAYDTTCHRDHIHISLSWEGAMKRTSYWTGRVAGTDYGPCREAGLNWAAPYTTARATPCPSYPQVSAPAGASSLTRTLTTYSGMVLRQGDSGPVVRAVQQAVGTTADGAFGPITDAAVKGWQGAHGVAASGVVDGDTWRALLAANAPARTTAPPARPTHPELSRYRTQTLRVGTHGAPVAALQRRLAMRPAGGNFGRKTKARVRTFQASHHLAADGVVGPSTWRALGA